MSHKHLSLLRSIYQEPISTNIHWREIESLLNHLGASIEPAHGGRFKVSLKRAEAFFYHPHHGNTCSRDLIKHLREFLSHAGVSVSSYESEKTQE